jgi:hypothetical protein
MSTREKPRDTQAGAQHNPRDQVPPQKTRSTLCKGKCETSKSEQRKTEGHDITATTTVMTRLAMIKEVERADSRVQEIVLMSVDAVPVILEESPCHSKTE